jgi:HPt (histidine-containing phosphotransfer) domain-containing protein
MQRLLSSNSRAEGVVLDLSYLKSLSEGNNAFVREMLTIFSEDIPELMRQLKIAVDAEDWKRVGQLAHKYRSPLSLLRLHRLEEIMKTMEYKVGEKILIEEMNMLFSEAQSLTERALESVQREIENH